MNSENSVSVPAEPVLPQREGRTFANRDGQPFPSTSSSASYMVRIAPDGGVWFDYADGESLLVQGITERRILAWCDRGLWRRVS